MSVETNAKPTRKIFKGTQKVYENTMGQWQTGGSQSIRYLLTDHNLFFDTKVFAFKSISGYRGTFDLGTLPVNIVNPKVRAVVPSNNSFTSSGIPFLTGRISDEHLYVDWSVQPKNDSLMYADVEFDLSTISFSFDSFAKS